jgi:hypothetical protein
MATALALWAVSSTSRSTSSAPRFAAARSRVASALTGSAARGAMYVVVLPAADDCGIGRCASPVNMPVEPYFISNPASEDAYFDCDLPMASVGPSMRAVAGAAPPTMDCRAHYDAVYDREVYGVAPSADAGWLQPLVDSARLLHGSADWPADNVRSMLLDVRNWLAGHVARRGWARVWLQASAAVSAAPPMDQHDPAEWIDATGRRSILVRRGTTAEPATVRSSRWLLHFAASSLNRMGLMLQAAAGELARFGSEESARQLDYIPR